MPKILVKGGTLVDPSRGLHKKLDLLIENGRVADIAASIPESAADDTIDASSLMIAPGFVELRAHLREPGGDSAETIETGTRAAAAGGYTTIHSMPNTTPPCDSETGVQYVISRAAEVGCVRVIPVAAITLGREGKEIVNFGRLTAAGAGAFSDDDAPVMNAEIMRRALEYTRMLGVPIMEHCEDRNLSANGQMNEGRTSIKLGLKGMPRVAESIMVSRNIALAAASGGHVHLCHVSTRESVEAIRDAKRSSIRVTAEVSPHHLTMTESAVLGYNANAKMRPPLREEEDRQALIAALADDTIDCIATDHAPHSSNAKQNVFDAIPFGVIGMESAFPHLYTEFVATGKWTLDFLIRKLTTDPAEVMGKKWGTLGKNDPADFCLIEETSYTFGAEHLRSKSENCPFLGKKMKARIAGTIVGGREAFASPDVFPEGIFSQRKKGKSKS